MPYADHPIPKAQFDAIYAKVPRLTVDLIISNSRGELYFTKRDIEPCAGQWHLPGGTVRFGETVSEALSRIAKRELGIKVHQVELKGYIDYPSHFLHGLDSPVALVFQVAKYSGSPSKDIEASDKGWFKQFPQPMHADQDKWLIEHHYMPRATVN